MFAPNVGDEEYAPPDIADDRAPASGSRNFTVDATEGPARTACWPRAFGDVTTITALPLDDVQRTISRLVVVEVVGSLAILAALGLVSWWVVHLGIRPVKEMTDDRHPDRRRRPARCACRSRLPGTESGELAVALNTMLGHLERSLDERAASEARLRRFVADASHELRTPVTTIRGYAELYRHGGLSDPAALDDAMRRTEQEAARIGRLVEDMLALARLDEQRPLDVRPVDLDGARPRRRRRRPGDVAGAADRRRRADRPNRHRRRRGSAPAGYRQRRRQRPRAHRSAACRHDSRDHDETSATLSVDDRGQGMTTEVAAAVTERFFRADPSRSRHRGGTGLGLSIVDATVSAHGGAVDIESEPGNGNDGAPDDAPARNRDV